MLRYMYIGTSSAKADKTWCPVFLSQEAQHNYMYMYFVGSFHYSCCIKDHTGIL